MTTTRSTTALVSLGTILIGGLVAIGVSYASLRSYATRSSNVPVIANATPPVVMSPSPPAIARGRLGAGPHLSLAGGVLVASGDNLLFESDDAGVTLRSISLPAGADGLVVAASDPRRRLTGGISLRISDDAGASWRLPPSSPPGPGPFKALAINPIDRDVWFAVAHGRLLRTRDGGVSWRELAGISTDASTLVLSTGRQNEFVVAAGGQIYELTDNGQQIHSRPGLPGSAQPTEMAVIATDPTIALVARASDGKDYVDTGAGWQASVPLAGPLAAIPGKYMVVGDGSGAPTAGQVEMSSDLGKTWSEAKGLPDGQSIDALASSADVGMTYAYTYGGDLLKSSDGINWTLVGGVFRS